MKGIFGNRFLGLLITIALLLGGMLTVGGFAAGPVSASSATVWGYVYDNGTGEVLDDVEVSLYNYDTDHGYGDYTDANGYYEFDNLGGGEWSLRFRDDEYYYLREYLTIGVNDNIQYDAYLDHYECTIVGTIYDLDTDEPIEDAEIGLSGDSDDGEDYYKWFVTGEDGKYYHYIPPGEYDLRVYREGYSYQEQDVDIENGEELQFDFYMDPMSSIYGTIYDAETQEVIQDLVVGLDKEGYYWWYDYDYSDENGEYALYMEPDTYTLRVREDGYKEISEGFTIGEDEHILYDIYLEEDLTRLYGYVYNLSSGEPLEGVYVSSNNWDTWDSDYTHTDEDGYYELYPGAGEVSLSASEEGYESYYTSIEMEEDVPQEHNIELDPYSAYLYGMVTDYESSDGLYDAMVTVTGKDFYESTYTNSDGEYSMYLDGGEYEVKVSAPGHSPFETMVTIEDGTDFELNIELGPYNTGVFGYVTDREGTPIFNATVTVQVYWLVDNDTVCRLEDYTRTDEEGFYELILPPSEETGTYDFTVQADGYQTYSDELWVEPDEMTQVDVVLYRQPGTGSIWLWLWELIFG